MTLLTTYNLHTDCCLQARSAYLQDKRTLQQALTHIRHQLVLISVEMLILSQGHSTNERTKSMKHFNDPNGNPTRDNSAVPQPTVPTHAPMVNSTGVPRGGGVQTPEIIPKF
jgi:hypothetical protein